MNLIRIASRATTGVVAGVAGFSSYRHIVEVAQRAGEHHAVAAVLPLSIDGLIVVGTMAMVEDKRAGRRPRLSARVALGFGVVATLAANIASAQPHLMARLVAAVPAVAFLITVEVLARAGRPPVQLDGPAVDGDEMDEQLFDPWEYAEPIGPVSAPPLSDNVSDSKPAARRRPPSAKDRVAAAHRRTPKASDEELAVRLGVSVKTIERHRPPKLSDNLSDSEPPTGSVNGNVPALEGSPV